MSDEQRGFGDDPYSGTHSCSEWIYAQALPQRDIQPFTVGAFKKEKKKKTNYKKKKKKKNLNTGSELTLKFTTLNNIWGSAVKVRAQTTEAWPMPLYGSFGPTNNPVIIVSVPKCIVKKPS